MEKLTKVFRFEDNAKTVNYIQKTASITNNSNQELDDLVFDTKTPKNY